MNEQTNNPSGQGARRLVRLLDSVVNVIILSVFVILLALGCYALWDSEQVYSKALESYTQYKPDVPRDTTSFEELVTINPDVFGWIDIYGTNMDYPIVQGEDNDKYINTTAKGEFALSGAIFLDYRNARDFSDFNSIIFGHHMDRNAMFGDLTKFNDKAWFDSHQYGNLMVNNTNHGLEIFAFLHADAYDTTLYTPGIDVRYNQMAYIDHLRELAVYWRDIGVSAEDHIVLLSTCTDASTNGRELIAARITDQTFDDPYADDDQTTDNTTGILDWLRSWFARFNGWWLLIPAVCILPAAILKIRRWQQRKRG